MISTEDFVRIARVKFKELGRSDEDLARVTHKAMLVAVLLIKERVPLLEDPDIPDIFRVLTMVADSVKQNIEDTSTEGLPKC